MRAPHMPTDEQKREARERLRAVDCRAVASQLGADIRERNRSSRQWAMRCLDAAAHKHGDETASASVGVAGWSCSGCGAKGDALDIAARLTGLDARRDFVDLYRAVTGELPPGADAAKAPTRELPRVTHAPVDELEPEETDPALVAAMRVTWDRHCTRPTEGGPTASYLATKCGITDPARLDHALARELPDDFGAPAFARGWTRTLGAVVAGAVYSATGELIGIRRRRIVESDAPKECGPRGLVYPRGGVYASGHALRMLRDGIAPRTLVIVEGLPDAIVWSARPDFDDDTLAVIGMWSGSFSAAHAARVPTSTRVIVATDYDKAGHAHAASIRKAFGSRPLFRAMPDPAVVPAGADWRDLALVVGADRVPCHAKQCEWVAP